MKTPFPVLVACLAAVALFGCKTPEKYARNNAAARNWLTAQSQPAAINVSGTWYSDDWGSTHLSQSGRNVTGHLGRFPVTGVVSGRKAFLTIQEDGWVYYTAVLTRPTANRLQGYYSRAVPYSTANQEVLELVRTFH